MNTAPIIITTTYEAPVNKVWEALTDKNKMQQWYFKVDAFEAEPGFAFSFYGQGRKGEQYLHRCIVTQVVPQKKLQYSWSYEGYAGKSLLTFELAPEGSNTLLRLTHEGLESFPAGNPDFAKESFIEGWNYITGTSLKTFLQQ